MEEEGTEEEEADVEEHSEPALERMEAAANFSINWLMKFVSWGAEQEGSTSMVITRRE